MICVLFVDVGYFSCKEHLLDAMVNTLTCIKYFISFSIIAYTQVFTQSSKDMFFKYICITYLYGRKRRRFKNLSIVLWQEYWYKRMIIGLFPQAKFFCRRRRNGMSMYLVALYIGTYNSIGSVSDGNWK